MIDGEGGEDTAISEHEVNSSIAEVDANKSNHDEEMSKKTTNTTSVGRIAEDLHSTVKSKDGDIAAATPHPVTGGGEVAMNYLRKIVMEMDILMKKVNIF